MVPSSYCQLCVQWQVKVVVLATRIGLIVSSAVPWQITFLEACQNDAALWMNSVKARLYSPFSSCVLRCLPCQGPCTIPWLIFVTLEILRVSTGLLNLLYCSYTFQLRQVILCYK